MRAYSAGKGDPYWYEWTVGLLKVVEMLHAESGIDSVTFQARGVKGWDDVVVRYAGGRTEFIQVKHSRAGRKISFGDLVATDDQDASLLSDLYHSWLALKLDPATASCILYTNREGAESPGKSASGAARPPLIEFASWLNTQLQSVTSLSELRPTKDWEPAWAEWCKQLDGGDDDSALAFLRALKLQTNQEDLPGLEKTLLKGLAEVFGISPSKAVPLLQALDHALRKWTTGADVTVTAEAAYTAMALSDGSELEHRAPPPPAPFFQSRIGVLKDVEGAIRDPRGTPIVFLCADPGAGKTSLISQLVNRRSETALDGLIGLRYFAFRPISPESPLIPPDADQFVRADRLWFAFLGQLRAALKGRLREYAVPLRSNLIEWPAARTHVLRIAAQLGKEMGRPFVLVIDGIDHAARAMRYETAEAKKFFDSLPSPDEIGDQPIRVLLAGQPPQDYPEYPAWLRDAHPRVTQLGLGALDQGDLRALVDKGALAIPVDQLDAVVRLIQSATQGNTLAAIFAAEEARTCTSVDEIEGRLASRHLGDGLNRYYGSIWEHAMGCIHQPPIGTATALAAALCLTPERLTGALLASAFSYLDLAPDQWRLMLAALGPLLVEEPDGYRVLHNDVRIYLHGFLSGQPAGVRRQGASCLVDHYVKSTSSRLIAHHALPRLFRDAGRETEWARHFTTDWVFEAAALGIPYLEMLDECMTAMEQGVVLRDWSVMQELACAAETLERWQERCEIAGHSLIVVPRKSLPAALHTEVFVRPLSEWRMSDLQSLIEDAESLVSCGEIVRARALLTRWLEGLSATDLTRRIQDMVQPRLGGKDESWITDQGQNLRALGSVCRRASFSPSGSASEADIQCNAEYHFESGWVRGACDSGPFDSWVAFLAGRAITFLRNYESALTKLASVGQWHVVRVALRELEASYSRLDESLRAKAAWWALRSGATADFPGWADALDVLRFEQTRDGVPAFLALCRALSWLDVALEPSAVAGRVYKALNLNAHADANRTHYRLLFRAAATTGRVASVLQRRGADAAAEILPPAELAALISSLWEFDFTGHDSFTDRQFAGQLAQELVDIGLQLGGAHMQALVEIAVPVREEYPMDHRRESFWMLHQRTGDIAYLRKWLATWLGQEGRLWADDSSAREATAEELIPLARSLGENELADLVLDRLRWLQITYRGHKDYSFEAPVDWLRELLRVEPRKWQDLGLQTWGLSEACSALGGDDRCSWDLGRVLGAGAWASGPSDVWQLFSTEYPDCGTTQWLYPTTNRIVSGMGEFLKHHRGIDVDLKIVGWCLAVGLSRWFDGSDIKELAELRQVLRVTAASEKEGQQIDEAIDRLTPGEARRNPPQEMQSASATEEESETVDLNVWLERIERGQAIHSAVGAELIRKLLSERPHEFPRFAVKILEAVGEGVAYSGLWHSLDRHAGLLDIAKSVSEDMLWAVVNGVVRNGGAKCAPQLRHVLLARDVCRGPRSLQSGLECLLRMHERWARGGRLEIAVPSIRPGAQVPGLGWGESVAQCLTLLLASRSAEVIETALVGIQALVAHKPGTISYFFKMAAPRSAEQYWILIAAEVWAARAPHELSQSREILESWLTSGELRVRVQAWIVLSRLARVTGVPVPPFPNPPTSEAAVDNVIVQPRRKIMDSPPRQHGAYRFVDHFTSAESTIERVESVTRRELHEVRNEVAERIKHCPADEVDRLPWPARIRKDGDTRMAGNACDVVLDAAFDGFMCENPLPDDLGGRFAQAYLRNEDAWILRNSPIPDDDAIAWPSDKELGDYGGHEPDLASLRKKLLLLGTMHRLADEEVVLAARVQVFSWRNDFMLHLWWQQDADRGTIQGAPRCPITLSGRSFVYDYGNRWEPSQAEGQRALVFQVGGQQRLALCFAEFVFAIALQQELGWQPRLNDPLVWEADGVPVARYERFHGKPRHSRSGHPRQPLVDRWVLQKEGWSRIQDAFPHLRLCDEFAHYESDVES